MTRVLVIDDSELVREAAASALELAGWDAVTVPDGEAGVQAAATQAPTASCSTSRCRASTAWRACGGCGPTRGPRVCPSRPDRQG